MAEDELPGAGRAVEDDGADRPRPDVQGSFPSLGPNHGFEATVPAAKGAVNVCVVAHNLGLGADSTLSCKRLVVK